MDFLKKILVLVLLLNDINGVSQLVLTDLPIGIYYIKSITEASTFTKKIEIIK